MEHLGIHTYECNTKTRRHFNIVPSFIFFSLKKKELTMNVGGCLLKEIIQLTDKRTEKLRQ